MSRRETSDAGLGFRLPASEKNALLRFAQEHGIKPSRVVRDAIMRHIEQERTPDGERSNVV